MDKVKQRNSKYSNVSLTGRDRHLKVGLDDIRMSVWFLASILYELDDLQHFSETVLPTDSLDIRKTAQILAKAQLELRKLINNRSNPKNGKA